MADTKTLDPPEAVTAVVGETRPASARGLAALAPGDVLGGRYEVLAELGRGTEGVVLEANDLRAGAPIALKLIPEADVTPWRLARLRRELALARRITHPAVVRTYDLVDAAGWVGLAMELVRGRSLREELERAEGPAGEPWLRRLAEGLAAGLAAAHRAGVVHRDLKPANVLLATPREGEAPPIAKITDFGVARVSEDAPESARDPFGAARAATLTSVEHLVGTPLYMSPEQLARQPPGPASDVYALGLLLHEAATGQVPLRAADAAGLAAARAGRAPPLRRARPDLSRAFCAVVDACLEPSPAARPADGGAVLARLAARPRGRRRLAAALGAGALAAGAVVAVVGLPDRSSPAPSPSAPPADTAAFRVDKRDLVVGERRRVRESTRRELRFLWPFEGRSVTTDVVDRTLTVLAADRRTILKLRLHYDEASHVEERFGDTKRTPLPVDGRTYVAEWRDRALVITDARYAPVTEEEEAIVRKAARALGEPLPELAAAPDGPLAFGDRADSLLELFRGALLRDGQLDLSVAQVRLVDVRPADAGALTLGGFEVALAGGISPAAAGSSELELRMAGRIELLSSGRVAGIHLAGDLELDGEDYVADGTLSFDLDARSVE